MKIMFIIVGFIILFVGGLVYAFVPYTTTIRMQSNIQHNLPTTDYTTSTTMTGNNPLGIVVMFIGFTSVIVGLFYKPEVAKAPEIKQENPQ